MFVYFFKIPHIQWKIPFKNHTLGRIVKFPKKINNLLNMIKIFYNRLNTFYSSHHVLIDESNTELCLFLFNKKRNKNFLINIYKNN